MEFNELLERIVVVCCEEYGADRAKVSTGNRQNETVYARYAVYKHFLKLGMSVREISDYLSVKRESVYHYINKHQKNERFQSRAYREHLKKIATVVKKLTQEYEENDGE